jgi:serine/threonine-protein kinase
MAAHNDPTQAAPFDDNYEIELLCDEFEESWKRGQAPEIRDYLKRTRSNLWSTLFIELVQIDMEYRSQLGDAPSLEEYASRFPEYATELAAMGSSVSDSRLKQLADIREIAGFQLLQRVGSGAFGVVWKAWDTKLEREVAVKLPTERSLSREYATNFRREAKAAAKLAHPGIVRVITYGIQDGIAYIVYDFIDGINLKQWAKRNPIAPKRAAALCATIADAVSHAHVTGVVHRDLKPGNILIDKEGRPFITDFGLAKRDDSASTVAGSGVVVGTLTYMSPEQAEGKSRGIDARADVYSIGAMLYELLAGRTVFQGDPREAIHKILHVAPEPLQSLVPGIDADLATICHKCLEKNPADRYRTAADLAADLQRYVRGEPVTARPISRPVRAWRWVKHHRGAAVVLLAVTVPLVALLVVQALKKDPQAAIAPGGAPQGNAVPLQPRTVHIITEPPGAVVAVNSLNPKTGEVELSKFQFLDSSPGSLDLMPGPFQVAVTLSTPEGPDRHHIVRRTVPGQDGSWRSLGVHWEQSRSISATEIQWPVIEIPEDDLLFEMVYIEGTEEFTYNGPEGLKTVAIDPFYVATREFTFGDYLVLKPDSSGDVSGRPATEQPPGETIPLPFDLAAHWAEVAGGRLLTDLEFAYLAHLADQAQSGREVPGDCAATFSEAGGCALDQIPTLPPIRGILTGYAEWTSTWVHSPLATIDLRDKVDHPDRPEQYRIIRGGTSDCGPGDYPREPDVAAISSIYDRHPHVGFRLARTVFDVPPAQETD